MSILRAMYSGVSGLKAEGEALGVVSDNLANVNTVGFKQSRSVFEDVLGNAVGAADARGAGVRMQRAQQIFSQGNLSNTGQATDLALSGDGSFVVNGTVDGVRGNFDTRAGQFIVQQDGTLATTNGMAVQGYLANTNGTFQSALSSVVLPTASISPRPTNQIRITANLDASATVPTLPWDPQNPSQTANFSTSIQVYDSLGNARPVDVFFRMTSPGNWTYHALVDGSQVAGGTPGQNTEIITGTLTFNASGALQATAVTAGGTASFVGAVPNQAIAIDFGNPIAGGGTGLDGVTQFAAPSNISAQSQDGYSSGDLSGVRVDSDGVVRGIYSNGEQIPIAQLAVARFRSNDGLGRAGKNLWIQTRESGEPAIGTPGSGGRAALVAGALEQSNVDIAAQFVELIAHQRAFQANSKSITTSDQMLQELNVLKQ